MPVAVFVSFRLGGTDGVSIEAGKWERALHTLGWQTRRVAGEILDAARPDDAVIPELSIGARAEPTPGELAAVLESADAVIVENLLSLPLNLGAARALRDVLSDHPHVLLHHHDLPWQRPDHRHVVELPPDLPRAVHVTINDRSRDELAERGITAHTIRNHFDIDPPLSDRDGARAALGLDERDLLLLHPVRAIPRKNVPGALALAGALAGRLPARTVRYWLPGPAEDGYEPELRRLLEDAPVAVMRDPAEPMADAYAACDLVVFPSTWEGFGNPVIEGLAHRRPVAVGNYPVLDELRGLGLEFLRADRPEEVAAVLAGTRDLAASVEASLRAARRHLSLYLLPARIGAVFSVAGWPVPRPVEEAVS